MIIRKLSKCLMRLKYTSNIAFLSMETQIKQYHPHNTQLVMVIRQIRDPCKLRILQK